MKVTAFIRKTAAKNNITDQARVYFRVRDIGGVDIKAASELSINPNHWSPERQGYKPRVALVSEEKKMNFDKDVQQITHPVSYTHLDVYKRQRIYCRRCLCTLLYLL